MIRKKRPRNRTFRSNLGSPAQCQGPNHRERDNGRREFLRPFQYGVLRDRKCRSHHLNCSKSTVIRTGEKGEGGREAGGQRRNKAHLCFPAAFVRISTRHGAGVRDETTNSVKGYGLRSPPQAYNVGPLYFRPFVFLFLIFYSVPLFRFELVEPARTGGQPRCRAVER